MRVVDLSGIVYADIRYRQRSRTAARVKYPVARQIQIRQGSRRIVNVPPTLDIRRRGRTRNLRYRSTGNV